MRNKKGTDLSLNIIIIAVILLVVMAVILAIFLNRNKDFVRGVQSCTGRGGTCADGTITDDKGNKLCAAEQGMLLDTDCNNNQNVRVGCCLTLER